MKEREVIVRERRFDDGILAEIVERKDVGELIRCKDCIYYDPPHVEKNGERHEYSEFPPEAFDTILLTENVTIDYGINVGGRCCRDYNAGYTDDKRVFVASDNYCGRAEPKE